MGKRGKSKSPPNKSKSPPQTDAAANAKTDGATKNDGASDAEAAKPLAPPPRPAQQQQQGGASPDYFSQPGGGSLSLEPNPFEQSFGVGGQPETPGGTKLPSVHTLTSPSSLLPAGNNGTPFNWGGGSLRTGLLSPAMLSGPANDYFGDTSHHLRGGFPTPNESSLRSGLTPGGSGSMFPAPSPNSQAFIAQLQSGGATPSTLDFHRTALSAAAKRDKNQANGNQAQPQQNGQQAQKPQGQQPATSQPQEMSNNGAQVKSEPKSFDPHDNDAANGLFMLAQGGNQNANQFASSNAPSGHAHPAPTQPHMNGGPVEAGRGDSVDSNMSNQSEQAKPNTRGKGKKNPPATNGRRKAEEPPAKAPASKKAKHNASINGMSEEPSDDEDGDDNMVDGNGKSKMTDEEKRKNFLERNRVAALKCRQRKKQWLANLQSKVEMFSNENEALTAQITQLREEVVNLKTLLLAHKDCPVTQQQGMHGAFMNQVGQVPQPDPFNQQMNPYQMAGPMPPNQQIMNGQAVNRRYS